jgi:hypothetical protein
VKESSVFVPQIDPSGRATLLPIVLFTKKKVLEPLLNNILKIPLSYM